MRPLQCWWIGIKIVVDVDVESKNLGCVCFICRPMALCYWLKHCKVKKNQFNEKRSLIPWGLKVPIWKMNFCSKRLRLSVLPQCRERAQTFMSCWLQWSGRLKSRAAKKCDNDVKVLAHLLTGELQGGGIAVPIQSLQAPSPPSQASHRSLQPSIFLALRYTIRNLFICNFVIGGVFCTHTNFNLELKQGKVNVLF